jgi:hypothetical protein
LGCGKSTNDGRRDPIGLHHKQHSATPPIVTRRPSPKGIGFDRGGLTV